MSNTNNKSGKRGRPTVEGSARQARLAARAARVAASLAALAASLA